MHDKNQRGVSPNAINLIIYINIRIFNNKFLTMAWTSHFSSAMVPILTSCALNLQFYFFQADFLYITLLIYKRLPIPYLLHRFYYINIGGSLNPNYFTLALYMMIGGSLDLNYYFQFLECNIKCIFNIQYIKKNYFL